MKILSRMIAKMPLYKGNVRIRYELEFRQDQVLYSVVRLKFVSGKLEKCETKINTHSKATALEEYRYQMRILSTYLL